MKLIKVYFAKNWVAKILIENILDKYFKIRFEQPFKVEEVEVEGMELNNIERKEIESNVSKGPKSFIRTEHLNS